MPRHVKDFVHLLMRRKALIAGLTVTALLVSALYAFSARPEWEASALLRVGQVTGPDGYGATLVELPGQVLERVRQESLRDSVLSKLGIPLEISNPEARLYRNSLKSQLVPGTNAVELKLRGHTPDRARQFMVETVGHIEQVHYKIYKPSVERLRSEIAELSRDIERSMNEREKTVEGLIANNPAMVSKQAFSQLALASYVMSNRDADIHKLKRRKFNIGEALSPVRTYPTSVVGRADISKKAVFPKRSLIIMIGGITGLLAGILMALSIESGRHSSGS